MEAAAAGSVRPAPSSPATSSRVHNIENELDEENRNRLEDRRVATKVGATSGLTFAATVIGFILNAILGS